MRKTILPSLKNYRFLNLQWPITCLSKTLYSNEMLVSTCALQKQLRVGFCTVLCTCKTKSLPLSVLSAVLQPCYFSANATLIYSSVCRAECAVLNDNVASIESDCDCDYSVCISYHRHSLVHSFVWPDGRRGNPTMLLIQSSLSRWQRLGTF